MHLQEHELFTPKHVNSWKQKKLNAQRQTNKDHKHPFTYLLPAVNIEVDDGRLCELDAFESASLVLPPSSKD